MNVPRFRFATAFALSVTLLCVIPAHSHGSHEAAMEVGKVRVSKDFKYAGTIHPKGRFEVRVESSTDGSFLVLSKDGQELVRELAIVVDGQPKVRKSRASVTVVTRDEGRIRLSVRHDTHRYLAFFEAAP